MKTWKPINVFEHYEINQFGKVRSWRKKSREWRNPDAKSGWRDEPVILKGTATPLGYVAYILRDSAGKPTRRMAHRLVAIAFLGLPDDKRLTDVAHNDGNPGNNHVDNLRWATHRDNQLDMRKHGTMQDGEKCVTHKISEQEAKEIRDRVKNGPRGTQVKIAEEYGISKAQVCRIANSTRWRGIN